MTNGTATLTVEALSAEVTHLRGRVARMEELLISFAMKHRELSIIEMGHIEDMFGLERTKPSRKREL